VRAAELRVGQKVRQADGGYATVTASWREEHPEGVPVFNLETEELHTYHVAQAGTWAQPLLVHNCDDAGRGTAVRNYKPEQPGFDAGMGKRPAQFCDTPPPAELGEHTPPGKYAPPGIVRPTTASNVARTRIPELPNLRAKHGETIHFETQTSQGPFDVVFDIRVEGDTLTLEGAIYHKTIRDPSALRGKVSREVVEGLAEIRDQARSQGFKSLKIIGRRHEGSSSAVIGHMFKREWNLE
jgi:hypothetical protein